MVNNSQPDLSKIFAEDSCCPCTIQGYTTKITVMLEDLSCEDMLYLEVRQPYHTDTYHIAGEFFTRKAPLVTQYGYAYLTITTQDYYVSIKTTIRGWTKSVGIPGYGIDTIARVSDVCIVERKALRSIRCSAIIANGVQSYVSTHFEEIYFVDNT